MLTVVIGITYGTGIGLLGNHLLFRKMAENKKAGAEPLLGIGKVFLLRYLIDAVALFLFGFVARHAWGTIAAGISLTVAVKISLMIVYLRKGGRFD